MLEVPAGPVPEAATAVREGVAGRPLVALGGGRVVDAAKAIAELHGKDVDGRALTVNEAKPREDRPRGGGGGGGGYGGGGGGGGGRDRY